MLIEHNQLELGAPINSMSHTLDLPLGNDHLSLMPQLLPYHFEEQEYSVRFLLS
ncbi:Uncharacterised protein [Streptococcus pneumoniae]|nr:Uncharacterised protein [Streptococcus pneumoniae]COH81936.1 Uncharacterised protein [Streptococcus pneumoniae]